MSCEYEKIRLRNIEDNKRILKELGLLNPFNPLPRVIKKAPKRKRARSPDAETQPAKKVVRETTGESGSILEDESPARSGRRRRSARLRGVDAKAVEEVCDEEEEEENGSQKRKFPKDRPNVYGAIPGIEIGTVWQMRSDCSYDGVHRPWVAGIHGGPDGAVSIALSGGYEDDIDMGDCFTYTGEGGRDLKGTKANPKNLRTAPQSKDQSLTKGNLALVRSCETGNPIRVIRGYKCRGPFAPEDGYRYDGLYKVQKYWFTTGTSGFGVYKFAFRRLDNQAPPPWSFEGTDTNNNEKNTDDNDDDDDDHDKKAAAEFERMTVEEKMKRMMERDGVIYDPSEIKSNETKSESETENMEPACDEDKENKQDEGDEDAACDPEEKHTEMEKGESETENKTVENVDRGHKKNKCEISKGEDNRVKEADKKEDKHLQENQNAKETHQTEIKTKEIEPEPCETDKQESFVDVEGESESYCSNEEDITPDTKEKNLEKENQSKETASKSEDESFSQESGFVSQENQSENKTENESKTEEGTSKPEPLREVSVSVKPKNIEKDEKLKTENKSETETPNVKKKTPKTKNTKVKSTTPKTPTSETKTMKEEGTSKTKSKVTTPKTTPKGKQLTMMDMFKPKM